MQNEEINIQNDTKELQRFILKREISNAMGTIFSTLVITFFCGILLAIISFALSFASQNIFFVIVGLLLYIGSPAVVIIYLMTSGSKFPAACCVIKNSIK